MGHVISATCKCGYEERNLVVGSGKQDHSSMLMQPAFCEAGRHIVCVNVREGGLCPEHGKSVRLYAMDPQLQRKRGVEVVSQWQRYVINEGEYLCPQCHSFGLTFGFPHIHFDDSVESVEHHLFTASIIEEADDLPGVTETEAADLYVTSVESLRRIEDVRVSGDVDAAIEYLAAEKSATNEAIVCAIVRLITANKQNVAKHLLATAVAAAVEGRTKIAAEYMYAYSCVNYAEAIGSISEVLSRNIDRISEAVEAGDIFQVGFDLLVEVAPIRIEFDDFKGDVLLQQISLFQEMAETFQQESGELREILPARYAIDVWNWWLVAWDVIRRLKVHL